MPARYWAIGLPDAVSITFDAIGVDNVEVLLLGQIHNPETAVASGVAQKASPLTLAANTDRLGMN